MDLDRTLCYCHHVTKRKIVNFVRQRRPKKASQISECFEAGSGCGWCIPFLVKIHREVMGGGQAEEGDLTPEEYEACRSRYIESVRAGEAERNRYDGPLAAPTTPGSHPAPATPPSANVPAASGSAGAGEEPAPDPTRGRPTPDPTCGRPTPDPTRGRPKAEPEDDFDYTRYFSRSRPDPEPENLR